MKSLLSPVRTNHSFCWQTQLVLKPPALECELRMAEGGKRTKLVHIFQTPLRGTMQLTRAADYGVRVIVYLSSLPRGTRVSGSVLANAAGVPGSFMSKVLQRLVKAGLILSYRGTQGGFELALSSEEISLLDVIEAIEGPIALNLCLMSGESCDRQGWCAVHLVWMDAQAAMVSVLRSASMAGLARDSVVRKAVVDSPKALALIRRPSRQSAGL